jgi:vancomycin resistance protein YoaR
MSTAEYTLYRPRARRRWPFVAALLAAALLGAAAVAYARADVPARTTVAGVSVRGSEADARRAIAARADQLLDRPIRVLGAGRELVLTGRALGARPLVADALDRAADAGPLDRIRAVVGLGVRRDVTLAFALDPARVAQVARELDASIARSPVDATVVVDGGVPRVLPGRAGRGLDAERLAQELRSLPATIDLPVRTTPPTVTAAQLQALGIREPVSEFATEYTPGEPRVVNIRRAAELLDGTIVPAGGMFSLNEALGERTTERGFVAAPQISGGRLTDSVGGGISQVATTLYAAFFAGLELVAHTPHSLYIDRYPAGREATISWGGPELIFRNDWSAGLLMKVTATDTSITVGFYSSEHGRRVETETGEPYDYVEPTVRAVTNHSLPPGARAVVQDAGSPGFTIDYTRRVYRDGELLRDELHRWRYDAKDAIVEVGPAQRSGV